MQYEHHVPPSADEVAQEMLFLEAYAGLGRFLGMSTEQLKQGGDGTLFDFVADVAAAVRGVRYSDEWITNRERYIYHSRSDATVFYIWLQLTGATGLVVDGRNIPAHVCFYSLAIAEEGEQLGGLRMASALAVAMGLEVDPTQIGKKTVLRSTFSKNGRSGGLVGKARREQLAAYAVSLARAGTWESADSAAAAIRPEVNKRSRELGGGDYAHRKIADWLRGAGFKRGGDMLGSSW